MRMLFGLKGKIVFSSLQRLQSVSAYFWSALALLLITSTAAWAYEPSIFLNNSDANISLKEGDSLNAPVFVNWGVKKDVEMAYYLWIEDLREIDGTSIADKYYMNSDLNFAKATSNTVTPVITGKVSLSYAYVTIPLPGATPAGLGSLKLFLCMSDSLTGQQTVATLKSSAICGNNTVEVLGECKDFRVSSLSIDKTLANASDSVTEILTVADCDNNPIMVDSSGNNAWLNIYQDKTGELNLVISPSVSAFAKDKDNTATIKITYKGITKSVNLTARVQSSSTTTTTTTNSYTITITQGANGTIACSATTVNYGGNSTCTITANTGYSVQAVTVDGASAGAVTSYTFPLVAANHTITASFSVSTTGTSGTGTTGSCVGFACLFTGTGTNNGNTGDWSQQGTGTTQCTPSAYYAQISPTSVSKSATVGQNAGSSSVSVTKSDGCTSTNLGYTVNSVTYTSGSGWITGPAQGASGTGTLSVTFSSAALAIGTYTANITVTPTGYSQQTIQVTLTVNSVPSVGSGTALVNQTATLFTLGQGSAIAFYFNTGHSTTALNKPIQVTLSGATNQEPNCDMLIQYSGTSCGSAPTVSDLLAAKSYANANGNSTFEQNLISQSAYGQGYYPALYGAPSSYFYYGFSGDSFELATINDGSTGGYKKGCYYVLVYNAGAAESNVNVSYQEPY